MVMNMVKYPDHMVFGLDIGTRNLVGTVGFRENEHLFRVAAQCVLEHETRAMMDGQIHDILKVSESIQKMKRTLENQIGRELKDVCIAAAGRVLKTVTVSVEMDLAEETVVKSDHIHALEMLGTEKAYEELRKEAGSEDIHFYCVGYSVIHYYLNNYPMSRLEEHKASRISADMIATFLPEEVIDGLYASVEGAGLNVENLTLEPIAAINVAIPEKFRLLNIALVDVGAGTSDICVTKDGSIIAYGMIQHAGDELTEEIARAYLVDFNTAEQVKQDSQTKEEVVFRDIMGLEQRVPATQIHETVAALVKNIADEVAEKIKELNGGKPVSAVFVVGGGGKVAGFTGALADALSLPKERVALRGEEVLGEVEFLQEGVKKDPLLVTPVGICYSYYESRNNFIYVQVNGERIKLYDNNKLTLMDAAMQAGFPNEDLFPKRGTALHYTVDGQKKTLRGEPGEAAEILLNGKPADISNRIEKNDLIVMKPSTAGAPAVCEIGGLPEYTDSTITFLFNGKKVDCPKFTEVNGGLVSEFYDIKEGDRIEFLNYYTLEQVLEFMDLPYREGIKVNHVRAGRDERVYENFSVDYDINAPEEEDGAEYAGLYDMDDTYDTYHTAGVVGASAVAGMNGANGKTGTAGITGANDMAGMNGKTGMDGASAADSGTADDLYGVSGGSELNITVNGTPVRLHGKNHYIMVDMLDFYPFDLSQMRGKGLELRLNGEEIQGFMDELSEGDQVIIRWKES